MPCRTHLVQVRQLMKAADWPAEVEVVSACVGPDRERWSEAIEQHRLHDAPRFTNAWLDEATARRLQELMGGSSSMALLVSPDGRVVHSNVGPTVTLPVLRETLTRKEAAR
jgi:hypothetical protein